MKSLTDRTPVGNHICVCICTYKRPDLVVNLLEKLQQQVTNNVFTYSAVIVDNDVNETAKSVVEAYKKKSLFNIDYFVEPEQNISLARNKAVGNARGNFIALIDDDEYPARDWLLKFYTALQAAKTDGVLGPVVPQYPNDIPKWIEKSKICAPRRCKTGTVLDWPETKTGSVLLSREVFRGLDIPFDPRFGLAGGEDQDFFKRMMKNGCRFAWCDEAIVYETLPQERWGRGFYIKKYLQMGGQTGVLARKWPFASKCKWSAKSILAIGFYALSLPFSLLGGQHAFMKCLLKGLYFFGWIMGFLWRPIIRNRY